MGTMTDTSTTEATRSSFRPPVIKTLFVGESAPAGGTFFYDANSQVFREMKKVFGCRDDFLQWFQGEGFYLDDLVPAPINFATRKERRKAHDKYVGDLSRRIADYAPRNVIALLKAIERPVGKAVRLSGVNARFWAVPFPGTGQQANFRREMADILPQIA